MNSLIIACCLLVLAANVDCRARPAKMSSIKKHDHHMMHKQSTNSTEQMEGMKHEIVKRSDDVSVQKKTVPIDWKALMETVSVVIQKVYELISAFASNLFSYALVKAAPLLKENLLPILIPTMMDQEPSNSKPVATLTSVNWRSAASTIFEALAKFQRLQNNQVA